MQKDCEHAPKETKAIGITCVLLQLQIHDCCLELHEM